MEKSAPPLPRRQASVRGSFQRIKSCRDDSEESASDPSDPTATDANTSRRGLQDGVAVEATPRVDRTVWTRTHDHITLHLTSPDDALNNGEPLLRGWRSPHGEPYRPLGTPDLVLKCTPRHHGDPLLPFQSLDPAAPSKDPSVGSGRREPMPTTTTKETPSRPHVLDMFPRNLRKRPSDDRHVKLALRLQESMAQYSPEKMRGLRRVHAAARPRLGDENEREAGIGTANDEDNDEDLHTTLVRLQEQHRRAHGGIVTTSTVQSPRSPRSPRLHVEHGDASFQLLCSAVHQGAARLQLVRNGQNFLGAIPTTDASLDLHTLKQQYDRARATYIADLTARTTRCHAKASHHTTAMKKDDVSDHDDSLHHTAGGKQGTEEEDTDAGVYLPYTTRVAQLSPHKPLPTLSAFQATTRDERITIRSLVSTRASMAMQSDVVTSPRKPLAPRGAGSRSSVQTIEALSPSPVMPSPSNPSRLQSRRASVVLTARRSTLGQPPSSSSTAEQPSLDPESDALARVVASLRNGAMTETPPSPLLSGVHSTMRLQNVVESVETAKHVQIQTLAKTLRVLDHGRHDCLTTKFRNLHIYPRLDSAMLQMRSAAELDRVDVATHNLASYRWYSDLLRQVLTNHARHGLPRLDLHPAESFCINVIRAVARQGRLFQREQLERLVLLLHPADVSLVPVQHILTFLRRVVGIAPSNWTAFFQTHGLDEPVEVFATVSEESTLSEKTKQQHLATIRSVVQIHQVIRRLTKPTIQPLVP